MLRVGASTQNKTAYSNGSKQFQDILINTENPGDYVGTGQGWQTAVEGAQH